MGVAARASWRWLRKPSLRPSQQISPLERVIEPGEHYAGSMLSSLTRPWLAIRYAERAKARRGRRIGEFGRHRRQLSGLSCGRSELYHVVNSQSGVRALSVSQAPNNEQTVGCEMVVNAGPASVRQCREKPAVTRLSFDEGAADPRSHGDR